MPATEEDDGMLEIRGCVFPKRLRYDRSARIAFEGVVEEVNEELIRNPGRLATDPYGVAWMMIVRPQSPDALAGLATGDAMVEAYTRWLDENDFVGCYPASS